MRENSDGGLLGVDNTTLKNYVEKSEQEGQGPYRAV
jgi:hypothetical protein